MKNAYKFLNLSRLASVLRNHSLTVAIGLMLNFFVTGCATMNSIGNTVLEELGDVNIFTDAEERQLGEAYVTQHEKQVKLYTDPVVTNYIDALGQRLVRHSKRNDIRYTFKVVETKGVNAYAVPGGFIYVHLDLIRAAKTESELAAVLGHEIGHIVGRHSMKRLTQVYSVEILKALILGEDAEALEKFVAKLLTTGLLFRYSRDQERESDTYGVRNVYDAGISPEGAAGFFETLAALQRRDPSTLEKFLSTHPVPSERVKNVRAQIAGLPMKSGLRADSSEFQAIRRRVR